MSQSSQQQELPPQITGQSGVQRFMMNACWVCKSSHSSKKKSQNHPAKRWGHSAIVHDKYMYVFGGYGQTDNAKQWEHVFRLDCMTFQWDRLASNSVEHPSKRDSHTCTKLKNKMYILGGSHTTNELWGYDLDTNEWTKGDVPEELEHNRNGHSAVALNDRFIYILGGMKSDKEWIYDDQWIYDDVTKLFLKIDSVVGDQISERESHSAVYLNDSVYIFGGQGHDSFYNDLYQVQFQPLETLEEIFEKVAGGEEKSEIIVKVEQIRSQSREIPSVRASHTAVSYLDRYMFVIGGEGLSSDLAKDNDENLKIDIDDKKDDEDQPVYPKNDIWVFETVQKTWTKLLLRQKNPNFQARCSHSCAVFKDQLIIFGGLKYQHQVIEDMMILHLKDSENHLQALKKEELKNICKYCQMIYGYATLTDEDSLYTKVSPENHIQSRVTISFVESIVSLLDWPLKSFGIFVENALILQEAKQIHIQLYDKKRYPLSIDDEDTIQQSQSVRVLEITEDEPLSLTYEEFEYLLLNFDYGVLRLGHTKKDRETIAKNGLAAVELQNLEYRRVNKKSYGTNLKIAALRLGQTLLIIHKKKSEKQTEQQTEQQTETYIGLVSTNKSINPSLEDLIVFNYKLVEAEGKVKCSDDWQKNLILGQIKHIFTEQELKQMPNNTTKIIIFDLIKINNAGKYIYELEVQGNDILSQLHLASSLPNRTELVDYSLKRYLQLFFLNEENHKIILNQQKIAIGPKYQGDSQEPQYYNLKDVYSEFKLFPSNPDQYGILIYQNGRLVQRVPKRLGQLRNHNPAKYKLAGYINVEECFQLNNFKDAFLDKYSQSILFESLNSILRGQLVKKRKAQIPLTEEPNPQKQIKPSEEQSVVEPQINQPEVQISQNDQSVEQNLQEKQVSAQVNENPQSKDQMELESDEQKPQNLSSRNGGNDGQSNENASEVHE